MMKVKFCGMCRQSDIEAANELKPDYVGFVFAKKSRRYITFEQARQLKKLLLPEILTVGVFVRESVEVVADLLEKGVIEVAQLHGGEDEAYIQKLRKLTDKPIMQAFLIRDEKDVSAAQKSSADMILLDSGAGTGKTFDWKLIKELDRAYFLAGGLVVDNVAEVVSFLGKKKISEKSCSFDKETLNVSSLYGLDVSSGIEENGVKSKEKMAEFIRAVRKVECENGK